MELVVCYTLLKPQKIMRKNSHSAVYLIPKPFLAHPNMFQSSLHAAHAPLRCLWQHVRYTARGSVFLLLRVNSSPVIVLERGHFFGDKYGFVDIQRRNNCTQIRTRVYFHSKIIRLVGVPNVVVLYNKLWSTLVGHWTLVQCTYTGKKYGCRLLFINCIYSGILLGKSELE